MILAAGRGERMRPLTDTCPKPLLEINQKPLIVYHLQSLKLAGIESVIINISWLGEKIQQILGDGSDFGLSLTYSVEPEALETAGGIVQALDHLDEEFIVINGDVYCDYDYSRLRNKCSDHLAHLILVDNPAHNPEGDFSIEQGLLSNIMKSRYTFSGIACYRKQFFLDIKKGKSALAPLFRRFAEDKQITAELYHGVWSDVGTPERLGKLQSIS